MNDDIQPKIDACELASSLLQTSDGYLDKVIKLWKIGNSIYGECWDTEFHVFGVIESDTDHLPTVQVRQHCSAKMLKNSDAKLLKIIDFYKQDVIGACNAILAKQQNV
ncbi:MAG: hypothetical protein JKY85_03095 [Porticoccus sp.]|nr:hypothetical protein [Porticoccus sp.]